MGISQKKKKFSYYNVKRAHYFLLMEKLNIFCSNLLTFNLTDWNEIYLCKYKF